jgi:hypothetical protein
MRIAAATGAQPKMLRANSKVAIRIFSLPELVSFTCGRSARLSAEPAVANDKCQMVPIRAVHVRAAGVHQMPLTALSKKRPTEMCCYSADEVVK